MKKFFYLLLIILLTIVFSQTLFCSSDPDQSYQPDKQIDFSLISSPGNVFQFNMMQKMASSATDNRVVAMTVMAVAGGVLTGIGLVLNIVGGVLISTGINEEKNYPDRKDYDNDTDFDNDTDVQRSKIIGYYVGGGVSLLFGVIAIGAGVPLLIVGLILRAKFAASLFSNDKICLKYDAGLDFQRAYIQVSL